MKPQAPSLDPPTKLDALRSRSAACVIGGTGQQPRSGHGCPVKGGSGAPFPELKLETGVVAEARQKTTVPAQLETVTTET